MIANINTKNPEKWINTNHKNLWFFVFNQDISKFEINIYEGYENFGRDLFGMEKISKTNGKISKNIFFLFSEDEFSENYFNNRKNILENILDIFFGLKTYSKILEIDKINLIDYYWHNFKNCLYIYNCINFQNYVIDLDMVNLLGLKMPVLDKSKKIKYSWISKIEKFIDIEGKYVKYLPMIFEKSQSYI